MIAMNKLSVFSNIALLLLVCLLLFTSFSRRSAGEETYLQLKDDRNLPQLVKGVDLDKTFTFAGEEVPTDNFDVRERLDRELLVNTYWHSSTLMSIKLSKRYFSIMEPILREEGVPDDFKYLAVAESSLRNAVSPAGARGIWQFMTGTARDYKLEVSNEIDQRYDVEMATRAACAYLKSYYRKFGSWTLAAAAYNMGGGNTSSLLREQRAESYYDLNLNEETSRYVFRIIALKEILNDPRRFGFILDEADYYPPMDDYKIVEVSGSVGNWGDFATEHGTTYRMLKVYNPWLRDSNLSNRQGKTYRIKIPRQ